VSLIQSGSNLLFPVSVETINNTNVLGDVCRSRREGQTGEDVRQDIFDLHRPRHCGKVEHCLLTIFSSHPYPPVTGDTPFVISIENRFGISFISSCLIRVTTEHFFCAFYQYLTEDVVVPVLNY